MRHSCVDQGQERLFSFALVVKHFVWDIYDLHEYFLISLWEFGTVDGLDLQVDVFEKFRLVAIVDNLEDLITEERLAFLQEVFQSKQLFSLSRSCVVLTHVCISTMRAKEASLFGDTGVVAFCLGGFKILITPNKFEYLHIDNILLELNRRILNDIYAFKDLFEHHVDEV